MTFESYACVCQFTFDIRLLIKISIGWYFFQIKFTLSQICKQ